MYDIEASIGASVGIFLAQVKHDANLRHFIPDFEAQLISRLQQRIETYGDKRNINTCIYEEYTLMVHKAYEMWRQANKLFGEYLVTDDIYQRAVDSDKVIYMPINMEEIDSDLKGYVGCHVGFRDEWVPILIRDGYLNCEEAYIYDIDCDAVDFPFYTCDDVCIIDATETPSSYILFCEAKYLVDGALPKQMVNLSETIRTADYKDEESDNES